MFQRLSLVVSKDRHESICRKAHYKSGSASDSPPIPYEIERHSIIGVGWTCHMKPRRRPPPPAGFSRGKSNALKSLWSSQIGVCS